MVKGMLERALRRYEDSDPAIRMRAKLFFLIYLMILVILPVAITYSALSHLHNPARGPAFLQTPGFLSQLHGSG